MTRIATSTRVPALRVRHCEDWLFHRIEALTNEQLRHLTGDNCDDCRRVRREVMWRWAKLSEHLTSRTIPTVRTISQDDYSLELSERHGKRLMSNVESLLAELEANDVITKRGELSTDEFHDMFFTHTAR